MENNLSSQITYTPEKSKQIALARLDIVNQWLEFRKKSKNKLQADYDFVKLHNTSSNHLFEILGKISRGSLHRWKEMLGGGDDYEKLLPQYKYASVNEYRTVLTDEEIRIFMSLLLHPNRISIGKAITLTKYKLQQQNQSFIPADITFRRYAKWFKDNNYDKWILARDGEKALDDKVEYDIYVPVEFTIATKEQKTSPILELDKLYDEFEQFIEKLKSDDFAYLYVEEFWEFKFLAWVKNDKIRFLIQDYSDADRTDSANKSYAPIIFDVLTDKEKFIENFETCYLNMKKEGLKIENKLREALNNNDAADAKLE